jgi:pyruvate,water dikinase
MHSAPYILWLSDPEALEVSQVGGKAANLARMSQAGLPVPPAFIVTAGAYREVSRSLSLERVWDAGAAGAMSAANAADSVRAAIVAEPVPDAIVDAIRGAYARFEETSADGVADVSSVAVRSSATAEDLPEASFAGQQDTFLNVSGADDVLDAVRRCWASLWTDRAVDYRERHGFDHGDALLAVTVQQMVPADAAGVLFTANPVNGRRDEMVINAAAGLGDAVVSGTVTPDTYVVRGARVVERVMAHPEVGGPQSVSDEEAVALATLGQRVQDLYAGVPQDIEWARAAGDVHLLQARPITTLTPAPVVAADDVWVRGLFVEILPDAPSPAFCSVLEPVLTRMLEFTFRSLGHPPPSDIPSVRVFYSQPYLNLRCLRAAFDGLPPASRERLARRMANPFDEHQARGASRPSPADLLMAARLARAVHRLPRILPAVVAAYYEALAPAADADPAKLSDAELADAVENVALVVVPPLVEWDFLLISGLGFVERIVDSMVERAGLPDTDAVRGALMSGVSGNLTMETNKALWRVAEAARADPPVVDAIAHGALHNALDRAGEVASPAFNSILADFLARYGHRESRMDIAAPTWGEDPTPVVGFLRGYLARHDARDPAVGEATMVLARRQAASDVAAALSRPRRAVFQWALAHAEALGRERDTMHFHWTACFPVLRRLLATLGVRFTALGVIDDPVDVFCLAITEMPGLARAPRPMQDEVRRRREAWHRDQGRSWPLEIRRGKEVYAEDHAADVHPDGAMRGIPGSPGLVTGTARVIRRPEDFGRLGPGEILVAPFTTPVWTPLFAVAGGLVTDTGGILSHGAIVAREYGIPAVMGVVGASSRVVDGSLITVDGAKGLVTTDA